ncbi:MotA/TolQ/ExbB proton channel family protein [Leptospira sp. GIMC2001]|uniref:MotA/TolQ/ExbB proton channel family protein n=1 Tax=Leptospira sp. GIMC2001 TaxID=1513297 RepID=UPI0023492BCB|nr:MotA/TolQ/ExbB proton channel family protein [Leptospira sp. GIMC2001]WCL47535.1 MotA/TolQ/ExbB proton channel family protein [Leptospira sp. GIMC2001]
MADIYYIILNAGWIGIVLICFSILNFGIFISVYLRIRRYEKIFHSQNWAESELLKPVLDRLKQTYEKISDHNKSNHLHRYNINAIDSVDQEWEEISHDLVISSTWIGSLAGIATLLGLLGTVIGIQSSFAKMQSLGQATLDVFASGVSMALSTTILGLLVAIPSYLLLQWIKARLLHLEKKVYNSLGDYLKNLS